jgi:transposase-like protein
MTQKRRKHSGAFKARVALEAVRGVKTINQIAAEHEIHPVQVSQWKKELETRMSEIFEKPKKANDNSKEREAERLERKVGQLTMDLDWLKKKCEQLQSPTDDLP